MWTRGELKERGMAAFKANYWYCVLVALILMVVAGGRGGFSGTSWRNSINNFSNNNISGSDFEDKFDFDDPGSFAEQFTDKLEESTGLSIIAILAIFMVVMVFVLIAAAIGFALKAFLLNPLELGCTKFFLRNLDEPAKLNNLSAGFDVNYKNVVKVLFFRDLYLFLWRLIPVAGFFIAIVKKYEYYMISYLMAEDPDMDKEEAFALSREMMEGQKWDAFVLNLSFIGWYILTGFTFGILGIFYVTPYVHSTRAALYDTLRGTDNTDTGYIEGQFKDVQAG